MSNTNKVYRTVSELQWPLLNLFAQLPTGKYMPLSQASKLDQRPLGSLYHRAWIGYRAGHGFYLTRTGIEAYDRYMGECRLRKNPESPFSHYFDPIANLFTKLEPKLKIIHRNRKSQSNKRGAA